MIDLQSRRKLAIDLWLFLVNYDTINVARLPNLQSSRSMSILSWHCVINLYYPAKSCIFSTIKSENVSTISEFAPPALASNIQSSTDLIPTPTESDPVLCCMALSAWFTSEELNDLDSWRTIPSSRRFETAGTATFFANSVYTSSIFRTDALDVVTKTRSRCPYIPLMIMSVTD